MMLVEMPEKNCIGGIVIFAEKILNLWLITWYVA